MLPAYHLLWAGRRKPLRTSLILVAAEEEAAAGEFTVTPQPQDSCPKPEGALRSQVDLLTLPAFQGYPKGPLRRDRLLIPRGESLEWDTESFGPSLRLCYARHSSSRWENPEPGQASLAQVHRICYPYTAATRSTVDLVTCHHTLQLRL